MSNRKSKDSLTIEPIVNEASNAAIDEDRNQAHPAVWISLSLFVAIQLILNNIISIFNI